MSDWVSDYYADIDALKLDSFVERHSEDARIVFGNNPPVTGSKAIEELVAVMFGPLSGLRHERRNTWYLDGGDTAVVEALVHYSTKGGGQVAVPSVSLVDRGSDGLVRSLRVYVDVAPVLARIAAESDGRTQDEA
jgi:hypothetical protein